MIKITNLYKTYNVGKDNECKALKDINVTFPNNGLFIIKGKSGSGKSTLLNIIAGFDTPTKGSIDSNYTSSNYSSFIFQEFELIDYLTVEENIKLFNKDEVLFNELINKYELNNILNHKPNEISGGQKQRVSLVRALMDNKPVLLCDEPTGNLDSINAKIVYDMLFEISKEKLVIVVTHNYELFNKNDGFIEIKDGVIIDNNIKESNDFNKIEVYDNKLSFNSKWLIIKNFIKNNKSKHILALISFILSFLLLISSINIISSGEGSVIYHLYGDDDMSSDLSRTSGEGVTTTFDSKLKKYQNKYNCDVFYSYNSKYDTYYNINIKRFYIVNKYNQKLLYGTNKLNDYEIIISDYNALNINKDLSKVCGTKVGEYTIVGIFKTNYDQDKDLDNDDNINFIRYYAIYMNEYTYNYYKEYYINNSYSIPIDMFKDEGEFLNKKIYFDTSLTYDDTMNDGEIKISYILMNKIFGKEYEIGDYISFKLLNVGNELTNYDYEYQEYTFKITEVMTRDFGFKLSKNDYDNIAIKYGCNFNRYMTSGLSCSNKSLHTIKTIVRDGFSDNGIYQDDISVGVEWLKTLSYIMLGVGVLGLVLTCLLFFSFVHLIFEKERKTIGILSSFGISKKEVIKIYFVDMLILNIISALISLLLEILVVFLINFLINKTGISSVTCLYYEFISIIFVLLFILVLNIFTYFIISKKINKKESIDLVYQR